MLPYPSLLFSSLSSTCGWSCQPLVLPLGMLPWYLLRLNWSPAYHQFNNICWFLVLIQCLGVSYSSIYKYLDCLKAKPNLQVTSTSGLAYLTWHWTILKCLPGWHHNASAYTERNNLSKGWLQYCLRSKEQAPCTGSFQKLSMNFYFSLPLLGIFSKRITLGQ